MGFLRDSSAKPSGQDYCFHHGFLLRTGQRTTWALAGALASDRFEINAPRYFAPCPVSIVRIVWVTIKTSSQGEKFLM